MSMSQVYAIGVIQATAFLVVAIIINMIPTKREEIKNLFLGFFAGGTLFFCLMTLMLKII